MCKNGLAESIATAVGLRLPQDQAAKQVANLTWQLQHVQYCLQALPSQAKLLAVQDTHLCARPCCKSATIKVSNA